MLSIATCKAILGDYGKTLSDSDVAELRDFLYQLGHFDFEHFQSQEPHEDSPNIFESIHRGTSQGGIES